MEETIALIDKIIAEHNEIMQRAKALEQVANDVEALGRLEEATKTFMPGRLDQKQGLQEMQGLLETIDEGLQAHFIREETGLLAAFEKHGDKKLASALHSLLLEHDDLRNRLSQAVKQVAELASGGLSRHLWEASAHDLRAHISHTLKLLGAHARGELELLLKLRQQLGAG